jgi:hypothetical protein
VFYLKLTLIAFAMVNTLFIRKKVIHKSKPDGVSASTDGKILAIASLTLWAGAVLTGRLLAYTYRYLDSSFRGY